MQYSADYAAASPTVTPSNVEATPTSSDIGRMHNLLATFLLPTPSAYGRARCVQRQGLLVRYLGRSASNVGPWSATHTA